MDRAGGFSAGLRAGKGKACGRGEPKRGSFGQRGTQTSSCGGGETFENQGFPQFT